VALGAFVFCAVVTLFAHALLAGLPDPTLPLSQAGTPSIVITDRSGRLLYEVIDPNGSKFTPIALDAIPPACRQATIATEDSRFYAHPGIDPLAIARAAWQDLFGGQGFSGASTLTQQVARNLYLSQAERNQRSLRRKLREAWLALRLESHFSKDQILALYLNTTYYGHFAVGIEAAAQAYFGVHAHELDLAQCAMLAGLPQDPAGYNPLENPDAAHERQGVVLSLMQKGGFVSSQDAADASGERLVFAATPFPIAAPHFVMWVQSQLEQLLPPGRLRAGGLRVTTTLDLDWQKRAEEIVSRQLAQLQPCAAGAPAGTCDPQASPERRVTDAALVALDPHTGAVLAMVGSPDYFNPSISGAVNAALAPRQPGSAIKPLTYAAAFDPERARLAGVAPWTPATLIGDVRTVFPTAEGQPYVPENYDLQFHGPVSARAALANSYNIPAVKALQFIGVDALIQQAGRVGLTFSADFRPAAGGAAAGEAAGGGSAAQARPGGDPQPQVATTGPGATPTAAAALPSSFGLALTLGGGAVRLLDLTAAYAAFANGGQRVTPYAIERVETLDGQVILEPGASGAPAGGDQPGLQQESAIDPRAAYLVTDILSDDNARLPAFGPGNVLEIGRPAAAKTGTTTDWRDNWTLGYTPDLAAGVWVGNADNTPMRDISGISGAGPIWHDFMTTVLRGTPPSAFTRPNGLIHLEVCADSGLLPGVRGAANANQGAVLPAPPPLQDSSLSNPVAVPCPDRRLEWFIAGTEPTEVDKDHYRVALDARDGAPAGLDTPPDALRYETIWELPPELRDWARANHMPLLADFADYASAAGSTGAVPSVPGAASALLVLTSPDPNASFHLDPVLPDSVQRLPVTAWPGPTLAAQGKPIALLVDGTLLASVTAPEYTAWWPLVEGRHTLQAMATGPNGSEILSDPVTISVN
jgi:membrane peptidoglycan carboxypeptidase